MRTDTALFAAQGIGLALAAALAIFAPMPGRPAMLVPLVAAEPDHPDMALRSAVQWAAHADAALLARDPSTGRVTIVAPTTPGLVSALAYGFVPIAAARASCGAGEPQGGSET